MTRYRATQFAILLLVLPAAVLLSSCKEAPAKPAPAAVKTEGDSLIFPAGSSLLATLQLTAAESASAVPVRLTGRLIWDEERSVRLYPAFAGKVIAILAKPGDAVKAGQALAMLASPDFGLAQSEASRAGADFDLTERNANRARSLHQLGVTSQKEMEVAESEHRKANAERQRTAARIRLYGDGGGIDQRLALKSPVSGTIVERNINPGQELRPDLIGANAPPMFIVTDPSRLWVQLDAGEQDLPFLRKGATAVLRSASLPGEAFPAVIESISDAVDPATRMIRVRGRVDNSARKLKAEMYITGEIERPMPGAVQVPVEAVFLRGNRHYVFTSDQKERFTRREVKTGPGHDAVIVVSSGLKPGDIVVANGNLLLQQLLSNAAK